MLSPDVGLVYTKLFSRAASGGLVYSTDGSSELIEAYRIVNEYSMTYSLIRHPCCHQIK